MLELFLKSTLLLGLGLGVSGCLPKNRPAPRHLTLLASLLALPLLGVVWALPPMVSVTVPQAAPERIAMAPRTLQKTPTITQTTVGQPELVPSLLEQAPAVSQVAPRTIPIAAVLGAVYALGVLGLTLRFLQDQRALRQLLTKTQPSDYRADFPVRLTPEPVIPLACGLRRPCIVLPETAAHWERERLAAVLLHESAHLKRRDVLWQAYATLLCALLWPHPLIWWVAKRLAAEAENACDAAVLEAGIAPSHYAGHLLAVAQKTRKSRPLAPSLGQPGKLERRIHTILAFVPARSLPILATLSLIAVALACVPLILVKLHPRLDTSKLTSQEILNRTEQAYATCTTYSDNRVCEMLVDDKMTSTQRSHLEFARDSYLASEFTSQDLRPEKANTPRYSIPPQKLLIRDGSFVTVSNQKSLRWPSRQYAGWAHGSWQSLFRYFLTQKDFKIIYPTHDPVRLSDDEGMLCIKAYGLSAEVRHESPRYAQYYYRYWIDPITFLIQKIEVYYEGKLNIREVFNAHINESLTLQSVPAATVPGLTPENERVIVQSEKAVTREQARTVEYQFLLREAAPKDKARYRQLLATQERVAYFVEKIAEIQVRSFATEHLRQLDVYESQHAKFQAVIDEARRQQTLEENKRAKLLMR